jgi:hypothetical protein
MTRNIVDALKAVIAARNWDLAGELADSNDFVDCLRCFSAPRRILYDNETPSVYMCLFCASCWYAHEKHTGPRLLGKDGVRYHRRKPLSECDVCDVVKHHSMEEVCGIQALRQAERRYLAAHGWIRRGELWDPPSDQHFKYQSGYTHNHAVNTLKKRQGESSQPRQPRNPRWSKPNDDE